MTDIRTMTWGDVLTWLSRASAFSYGGHVVTPQFALACAKVGIYDTVEMEAIALHELHNVVEIQMLADTLTDTLYPPLSAEERHLMEQEALSYDLILLARQPARPSTD